MFSEPEAPISRSVVTLSSVDTARLPLTVKFGIVTAPEIIMLFPNSTSTSVVYVVRFLANPVSPARIVELVTYFLYLPFYQSIITS